MSKTFEQILHEEMFGYSMGGKEPIQNFIVRDIGSDFRKAIKPLAPWFIKEVEAKAKAAGLGEYLSYVWWMIYEKAALWPTLGDKEETALFVGKGLVSAEYLMPSYDRNFRMPPVELEGAVDNVIKVVAKAAKSKFTNEGAKHFLTALRKNAPRLQKAYPQEFKSVAAAQIALINFVKTALGKYRFWFDDPTIQDQIINILMAR